MIGVATYTVERVAIGAFALGVWADGASSTLTVRGSWQPVSGRTRQDLPEGIRNQTTARLFCDASQGILQTTNLATRTRADVVQRGGRRYEILAELDWADHAAPTRHRAYALGEIAADEEVRR